MDGKASKLSRPVVKIVLESLFLQKIKMEVKAQVRIALQLCIMGNITNKTDFLKPICVCS